MSSTSSLRVLVVHESYTQAGGEDAAVDADVRLLSERGHQVDRWSVSNDQIRTWPLARRAALLWRTTWSRASYREMRRQIERMKPDVVHFHNTLPIISPSAIHAAHDAGATAVVTLHNYRLVCPVATLLREGRICEECRTRSLLRSIVHGCYRGSRLQSATVALMLATHRRVGTWDRCVDAFISPTRSLREKAIEAGLPASKVHIRPNAVLVGPATGHTESYVLFVGRLSEEKGLATLLEAARLAPEVKIKIIGAGPMEARLRTAAPTQPQIELTGALPHSEVVRAMHRARMLLFPSIWYEPFGLAMVEALACGVPVIASRLGSMAEIITDGHDGFLCAPGDARALADRMTRLMGDDGLRARMSQAARATYEARYSVERCYETLMEVYRVAIESSRSRGKAA